MKQNTQIQKVVIHIIIFIIFALSFTNTPQPFYMHESHPFIFPYHNWEQNTSQNRIDVTFTEGVSTFRSSEWYDNRPSYLFEGECRQPHENQIQIADTQRIDSNSLQISIEDSSITQGCYYYGANPPDIRKNNFTFQFFTIQIPSEIPLIVAIILFFVLEFVRVFPKFNAIEQLFYPRYFIVMFVSTLLLMYMFLMAIRFFDLFELQNIVFYFLGIFFFIDYFFSKYNSRNFYLKTMLFLSILATSIIIFISHKNYDYSPENEFTIKAILLSFLFCVFLGIYLSICYTRENILKYL